MRNEIKKQLMTLSILLAAILITSIGFAAFSSTLRIKTKTTVTPNSSDFKVVFSSSENSLETNPVKANPETLGDDAIIDNTTQPTISGLNTYFTNPGDSVTYTFFVRNEGEYEAFLNSISFRRKTCTPEEGTNAEMVIDACNAITTTVNVGSITTAETLTDITGESLIPGQSKQVTVTVSYDLNGARANGPFTVEYGNITMYYNVMSGINEKYTGPIYRNSTEELYIGDDISAVAYETTPLNINKTYYLKHDVVEDIVTASYACITYIEDGTRKDVCIRGGDSSYYASNQTILRSVESYFNTLDYNSSDNNYKGYCSFGDMYSYCNSDSLNLDAHSVGEVYVHGGSSYCDVNSDGISYCY